MRLTLAPVEMSSEPVPRAAALVQGSARFTEKAAGTVTDSRTGLTWVMLDSRLAKGGCLTYTEALAYAKRLDTGGFRDWRLPTAEELKALLRSETGFPGSAADWYWSKNSYRSYSGGWMTWVDVVGPGTSGAPVQNRIEAAQCGWVRAVRP